MKRFTNLICCLLCSVSLVIVSLTNVGCKKDPTGPDNHPPTISRIDVSLSSITPGAVAKVSAVVTDPEGDLISYTWSTPDGTIDEPNKPSTTWNVSSSILVYSTVTITLTATDGKVSSSQSKNFTVAGGIQVSGYVYYSGTTIPVSGATVKTEGLMSTTGADGKYILNDVASGKHQISVTKTGFDAFSQEITVSTSSKTFNFPITSSTETKRLYGKVQTIDGLILGGVRVTVLNPDGKESGLSDVSDVSGNYQLSAVPQGTRTLKLTDVSNANECKEATHEVFVANFDKEYNPRMKIRRIKEYFGPDAVIRYDNSPSNKLQLWQPGWLLELDSTSVGTGISLGNCIDVPSDVEAGGTVKLDVYIYNSPGSSLLGLTNGKSWINCDGTWGGSWIYNNGNWFYFRFSFSLNEWIGKSKNIQISVNRPDLKTADHAAVYLTSFQLDYYW